MEYRTFSSTQDMLTLKSEWESIENMSKGLTYFSTFRFCYARWLSYSKSSKYRLWIICIYHNNQIIGIAPLVFHTIKKKLIMYTSLRFLSLGDYADFVIDNDSEVKAERIYSKILSIIEQNDNLWDEVSLTHISHRTQLAFYLFKSKYNVNFHYLVENPYIDTKYFYVNGELNKEYLPNKTKQYSTRLKKVTDYKLVISHANLIEKYAQIHISQKQYLNSISQKKRHSLYDDSSRKGFFETLFEQGDGTTYQLLDCVTGDILIYNFGFIHNRVFHSVNTAFNPNYVKYGVGKVMYYEILKENLGNPLWDYMDTGCGRYQWKFEWATGFNLLYRLYFINPRNKKLIIWRRAQDIKRVING